MEARIKRRVAEILVAILLCLVWVPPAHAACANPSGSAGDMRYNPGFKTPEYCDGASWVAMGPVGDTRTGLVGWWKLDDGSGTSAADSSGNGNTGTLVNSPTWTAGINGGALTVAMASSQYVSAGDPAILRIAGPWTVSGWMNPTTLPSSGQGYTITSKDMTSFNATNYGIGLDTNSGGCSGSEFTVWFNPLSSTTYSTCGNVSVSAGTWYLVTGVWDGTTLSLYVNGALAGTSVPGVTPASGGGENLTIGKDDCCGGYANATIDDVRVYNRALSAQDVLALYNSTGPLSGDINSNLVGWWKFDDGSSGTTPTTAADSSGNGNTGATQGSPVWTSAGKIGNALTLNGTSQYLDIPTTAALSFERTNPFSLTGWVYRTNATGEDDIFGKINSGTTARGYALWMPSNGESLWCPGSCSTNSCIDFDLNSNVSSSNELCVHVNSSGITTGAWHFVAATYDGSSTISGMKVYVDGVPQTATSSTNSLSATIISTSDLVVGTDSPAGSDYFGGSIDDLRVYSRALSASDVLTLYNSTATSCANPVAQAGHIIYNAGSYHVLQYCDGAAWKALGPVLASTGGGCSGPAGSEGDIIYNSAKGYMQYCNGANWIAMGSSYYGPQQGLVGWWKLDETSGTSAADSSGNGNTGTLQNSPTWTTGGMNNGALTFNGSNQYVDSSNFADNLSTFTVSAWFKTTTTPSGYGGMIVSKLGAGGVASGKGWALLIAAPSISNTHVTAAMGMIQTDSLDYVAPSPASAVNDGNWHQAVMVVTGGNTVAMYLDGASSNVPNSSGTISGYSNTSNVRIGTDYDSEYFNGAIDDVRIYNRALSASEVWQLYLVTGGQ